MRYEIWIVMERQELLLLKQQKRTEPAIFQSISSPILLEVKNLFILFFI